MKLALRPSKKQKLNNKKFIGFDIETAGKKNKFVMGSLFMQDGTSFVFWNKEDFLKEILQKKYRHHYFFATNLGFDFLGMFWKTDEIQEMYPLTRGSSFLKICFYVKGGKLVPKGTQSAWNIQFLDTGNYARYSVEELGKMINIPKLNQPKCFKRFPRSKNEAKELEKYNIRDSEISLRFMEFYARSVESIGGSLGITAACTALQTFKNIGLKDTYYRASDDIIMKIMLAYFGGRVEAFERGLFKNYHKYDVVSLYPYVMAVNKFPNPNFRNYNRCNNSIYYKNTEGFSRITIDIPEMDRPPLPYKHNGKLMFPCGKLTGWWTNVEIRHAVSLGCVVMKVYENIWYSKTCEPFLYYNDLFKLKQDYKKEGNKMEKVIKLILNSLFGKFAQRNDRHTKVIPSKNVTIEDLEKFTDYEFLGDGKFIRIACPTPPSYFCFPEWSAYITAYARLHVYPMLKDAIYTDTDSVILPYKIPHGDNLGQWAYEGCAEETIIIKPKFYAEKDKTVKLKGCPLHLNYSFIKDQLRKKNKKFSIKFEHFVKFKEAIRRNMQPNEIIDMCKTFSMLDDKRLWISEFSLEPQKSQPLIFNEIKLDENKIILEPLIAKCI